VRVLQGRGIRPLSAPRTSPIPGALVWELDILEPYCQNHTLSIGVHLS
jgi:hypothetical protein